MTIDTDTDTDTNIKKFQFTQGGELRVFIEKKSAEHGLSEAQMIREAIRNGLHAMFGVRVIGNSVLHPKD